MTKARIYFIRQAAAVSLETVKIVRALPAPGIEPEQRP